MRLVFARHRSGRAGALPFTPGKVAQITDSAVKVAFPSDPQKRLEVIAARAKDAAVDGQPEQNGAACPKFERSELERTTPVDGDLSR